MLLKELTKTVQNEVKEQKRGFLSALLGTSLLGDLLIGKGVYRTEKRIVRAGYGNNNNDNNNNNNNNSKMDF